MSEINWKLIWIISLKKNYNIKSVIVVSEVSFFVGDPVGEYNQNATNLQIYCEMMIHVLLSSKEILN